MRAAFGLVGLLVCVAIIAILFANYNSQVATSGVAARTQAEQIAGVDSQLGGRTSDHFTLEPYNQGSKLTSLQVKAITPGSSFQTYYGLQTNDYIDVIGPQSVKDIGDFDTAKALATEAYQRQWQLGIWRNGRHLTLPDEKNLAFPAQPKPLSAQPTPAIPATPIATNQPAAQPQEPGQPAQPAKQEPYVSPLQRQLDAISGPR